LSKLLFTVLRHFATTCNAFIKFQLGLNVLAYMHKHYICPLTGIFVMLNNCPSVQAKPNCTVPTTRSWTWSPRRPRAV